MRFLKPGLALLLVLTVGAVQAGPDDQAGAGATASGGATVSGSVTAKLSTQEMTTRGATMVVQMEDAQRRLVELQLLARKATDIIKLNCVNDKLLQVKQLLNIAEGAKGGLEAGSEEERTHAYTEITVSSEKVATLRGEAEGCVGEGEMFVGPSRVIVTAPRIVDDPTMIDPFRLAGVQIERPTYATPFL